jgi:heme/copper-type cytochrome/quinol oxidase subunit 3
MKKIKTLLKIAIAAEILSVPLLAILLSTSSCSNTNNGTDCGVAGFGAAYMIFPLILTVLLYLGVRSSELAETKFKVKSKRQTLLILLGTALVIFAFFQLYFQSIS